MLQATLANEVKVTNSATLSTITVDDGRKSESVPVGKTFTHEAVLAFALEYFNGDGLAANTWVTKYALRNAEGELIERTPRDMHRRLAREFARIEAKYSNPMSEDEIFDLFADWSVVPQGSPMSGVGNPHKLQSVSNCFVIPSPEDSYGGILRVDQQQAQIMKRRGGVGFDLSTIRPQGLPTANAAHTTDGIGVFMERFSRTCREVAQGGRRGALMLSCDVHHPEILTFIRIKNEMTKCRSCGQEERTKVTGANVSVRLSDEFLNAVEKGEKYQLRWPCDVRERPSVEAWVDARQIWEEIIQNARDSAEPGLLFWDNILRESPADCYADVGYKTTSTNPCMTAETLVAVADGRGFVEFATLAAQGRDVPVYARDAKGNVVVRQMRNPGVTGHQRIMKITLDDGSILRCTENHKFLLREGVYAKTSELKPGDSLHIGYRYEASIKDRWPAHPKRGQNYFWLKNCDKTTSKSEHRLIWEAQHGAVLRGDVIHHVNFDAGDNRIENLRRMTKADHDKLHSEHMRGSRNPIHAVLADPARSATYRAAQSKQSIGESNPNFCGLTNEQLLAEVGGWIRSIGEIPTKPQYLAEANERGWPLAWSSDGWRAEAFSSVNHLIKEAAAFVGVMRRSARSTSQDPFMRLLYARSMTDLPLVEQDGSILVEKKCEHCEEAFHVPLCHRGQACCSLTCQSRKHAQDEGFRARQLEGIRRNARSRASQVQTQQLRVFTDLRFRYGRAPLRREWEEQCKVDGVSGGIRGKLKFGFKSFHELGEAAVDYNHRVVSIEEDGVEGVYNGSVDEFHNYYVGGNISISKYGKPQRVLINSLNCAELPLAPGDSCRLMVVNVSKFVLDAFTSQVDFAWGRFHEVVRKAQRLMDDLVDIEIEHVDRILAKIETDPEPEEVKRVEIDLWRSVRTAAVNGRRTGLGVTAIGDVVAMMGMRYGSEESIEFVEKIYKALAVASYESSVDMAAERGCFPVYDFRKEEGHPFISRVMGAAGVDVYSRYEKYGRRNIANLTTAPTGSVSILTQTTAGIEPVFKAMYIRKKKINSIDENARVDEVDSQGDRWTHYTVKEHGLRKWQEVTGHTDDDFEKSPYYMAEAEVLDWQQRVRLQAAATRWIDHSLSSTVNLPNNVTTEEVAKIYVAAWKSGCKGITVYREGSRDGVLIHKKSGFTQHSSPKRPERMVCDVHRSRVRVSSDKYEDWIFFVGLLDGQPYEVFGGMSESIVLPRKVERGWILKRSFKAGGKYDFAYGDEDDPLVLRDIVKQFGNPNHGWATRMVSLTLRHGAPLQYVVGQLGRDKESDMFDFGKSIARALKGYIPNGTTGVEKVCPDCSAEGTLAYQEGCLSCRSCGYSKCG